MFSKVKRFFKKSSKNDSDKPISLERRAAERTTLPDTSGVDGICVDASAPKDQSCKKAAAKAVQSDDPFGFSINLPETNHDEVHQTIAVQLPELGAACLELKKAMRVKDISATGIGLHFQKPRIKAGTKLTLILATKKTKLTTNLKITVKRHEKGILGGRFIDLTDKQDILLSKLVLEGQKRQRANRQKRKLPKEVQDVKL